MGHNVESNQEKYRSPIGDYWVLLANILTLSAGFSAWAYTLPDFPERVVPWALTAASIFVVGRIADTASTIAAIPSVKLAERLKLVDTKESNVYLPDKPERSDFFKSSVIAADGIFLTVGMLCPPVGISFGVQGVICAASNILFRTEIDSKIKNHQDHDKIGSQDASKA